MIVMYKGMRGAGKTLTMVKDAYLFHKNGYRVFGNLKTDFTELISSEEIIEIDKGSDIYDCVLIIDEIQIFFDSRRSMAKQNLKFSNFIQQIRKRHIIVLCTTQYSNTIDLRLRQHLDIVVYPTFIDKYKICRTEYIDLTSLEDIYNPLKRKTIIYDARPVFKMFDTDEIIA